MYIDKKLSGVTAVQTLSRLNRMYPNKKDTFVLDFVNDPEIIKESFDPYYKVTNLEEETDPNILYELEKKLSSKNVFLKEEVEAFVKDFLKTTNKNQAELHRHIDHSTDCHVVNDTPRNDRSIDFQKLLL